MTTRKELESVIATVINQHRLDGLTSRELAYAIRDKVEPLIRADERSYTRTAAGVRVEAEAKMADLRAKVEALRETGLVNHWVYQQAITDVLAIIDGSSA